jgi:UPF0755 protein
VIALGLAAALISAPLLYLRWIGLWGAREPGRETTVVVPEGAGTTRIGRLLEDRGVVASALGFRIAAFLDGSADEIEAGSYTLDRNLTARAALAELLEGPDGESFVNVTFPEGSWLTDFARIAGRETHLARNRFLRLARRGGVRARLRPDDIDTLEGLLFPSTYQVVRRDTPRSLLERLVSELEQQMSNIDLRRVTEMGYTPYEVVIVASMVEAEARVPGDRKRIAAVIYNRLGSDMMLGIDATVSYALGEHRESLTQEDLEVDSPYNTRRYGGLPPTPIGAPGRASLEAAAAPADGDWLYYVVADCSGNHAFSESYEQFLADKAAYRALSC